MRVCNRARWIVLFPAISLIFGGLGSLTALAAPAQQTTASTTESVNKSATDDIQRIIDKAESHYRLATDALAKGDSALARQNFDQALDAVLLSGTNLRSNSTLDRYYRELVDRVYKHEAKPTVEAVQQQRTEVVEPSVLDELSKIRESELTTVTKDGMKIYGKYDFEFSVAAPVFQFITYFTEGRGRSTMEAGLQRSGRYRQMAEKIFKEERVPVDLIWLAQAESVWKPKALSHAAAKGIWQFIPSTGAHYGLAQTAWVDDRSHPEKSTRAAAKYLRFLYDHFAGDWLLAMAAYNSGENRVDNSIARCGYADFWEIHRRGMLPQETRNYVPIILAIMIVSKNQKRYGFDIKPDAPLNYDTYDLPAQTDLKVAADLIGVPFESMVDLNPELRRGVSPPDRAYTIRLPKGMRKPFEVAYAALPADQRVRSIVIPREEVARSSRGSYRTQAASYKVRRGDTLSQLARRSGVSVEDLARANGISRNGALRAGQTIKVPGNGVSRGKASKSRSVSARVKSSKRGYRSQPALKSSAKKTSGSSRSSRRR
jgi:membrane-bound lytic murein transglycosylase D